MALNPKRLGKSKPAATTNAVLYAAPNTATGHAGVTTLTVCNTGGAADTFRVAVCNTGISTPAADDYIYYGVTVPVGQTFAATIGVTLGQDQRVVVYSGAGLLVFNAFGQESA